MRVREYFAPDALELELENDGDGLASIEDLVELLQSLFALGNDVAEKIGEADGVALPGRELLTVDR